MKKTLTLILCFLLCFGGVIAPHAAAADNTITVAQKTVLVNAAPLSPVTTGYAPLDTLVQQVFTKILTKNMTTYQKVRACFQYLMQGKYAANTTTSGLYSTLWQTVRYVSDADRNTVCEAYGMLTENRGTCIEFAAAMMVMTRAIGLQSFVFSCNNTTIRLGTGDHYVTAVRLKGTLYLIDPAMNIVMGMSDVIDASDYFLTPLVSSLEMEFCDANELMDAYGGFRTKDGTPAAVNGAAAVSGAGENIGYTFGSYPQSRVDDPALITVLNGLLDRSRMRSYGYSAGDGTIGSQKESAYMRYADVAYGGEKYRAVLLSAYRPAYTFYAATEENTKQDENGYLPGTVYWFRFEPIEWRVLDGDTLLVADLLLDAQPFNKELYKAPQKKTVDGKTLYRFADAALNVPCGDWSRSSLREWLNRDFYDTAFSAEEKAKIGLSTLENSGRKHLINYKTTEDRIFLLSEDDVGYSDYVFAKDVSSRIAVGTEYAKAQGLIVETRTAAVRSCWLLRTPGAHSDDVCMVSIGGKINCHCASAFTLAGIRPALRLTAGAIEKPQAPEAPRSVQAVASASQEITVTVSPVNGVDGYTVTVSPGKNGAAESVYETTDRKTVIGGLTPGVTYTFRAAAFVDNGGEKTLSAQSDPVEAVCHIIVASPVNITGKNTAMGEITLQWDPVPHAVGYRVYRHLSAEKIVPVGYSKSNVCKVSCMHPGYTHVFRVTAVTADGYESALSDKSCRVYSAEFPGEVYRYRGDLNADKRVDAADARLALRAAVGLETIKSGTLKFRLADVSFDGVLSAEDARLILRAAVGLDKLY